MRDSCSMQLLNVVSVLLLCMFMQLSVGTNLASMTRTSIEGTTNSSTMQEENDNIEFYVNKTANVKTVQDIKNHSNRIIKSLLLSVFDNKLEAINKPKIDNSTERNESSLTSSENSVNTTSSSRSKRNDECSENVRRRAVCPWEYEYYRNDTLYPEVIQTVSCQSEVTLLPHLTIQCHQLYTHKLFKKRGCDNTAGHACFVRLRVKSACVAAFPCIIHTSG